MLHRFFTAMAATVLLAGCQWHTTTSTANEALNAEADALFEDLLAERDDAIVARMSSANQEGAVRAQLPVLRDLVDADAAPDPQVVSVQSTNSNTGRFYSVQQSYTFPDRRADVTTEFEQEGEDWRVRGFNINVTMTGQPQPEVVEGQPTPGGNAQ